MWSRRVPFVFPMTNTCPDCGASMELEQREVRLRTGVCPSCAKEFAFVEGATVSSHLGAAMPAAEGEGEDEGGVPPAVEGGPECDECGSPFQFREGPRNSIIATCPECETSTEFVPKRERPPPSEGEPARFEGGAPRGRPCRQCGAPLKFSTGEDGMLVGECASCGNRFTLPPRPGGERGGGRYGGPSRYGRRDFRRGGGGRPPYPGRGGNRPYRRYDRRGPPRDADEDRPRRRRRPRDE